MSVSRRAFLVASVLGPAGLSRQAGPPPSAAAEVPDSFPAHDPALAREMVGVSHGNVARVRDLLAGRPALAKAAWDWGFGDWETALGAASHVGNRAIAELLIDAGAPVTIFSAAMLDQLDAVQALVAAAPGVQRVKGPHGIPLMAHAQAGKARTVIAYLESLGDADPRYRDDPLEDDDRAAIVGGYRYGSTPEEQLTVSADTRGRPIIRRGSAPERRMFHQGGRVFHPSGAEAVRIRFAPGQPASELRIEDGPMQVVARRV